MASLRLHSHTERMLRSSPRCQNSSIAAPRFAARASTPIAAYDSLLWIDVAGAAAPTRDIGAFLRLLRETDTGLFQRRLLAGILHDEGVVADLAGGRQSVNRALTALPEAKREWLAYVGLCPRPSEWLAYVGLFSHDPATPPGALIKALVDRPEAVQRHTADTIEAFWDEAFGASWAWLAPRLERSRDRAERLFASATLAEFAAAMRLLVEIDEKGGALRALRGGYRIALDDLDCLYFMPSAFNHRRFWSVSSFAGDRNVAFLPFFDHALDLAFPHAAARSAAGQAREPLSDPGLACKALGDATRFSMVALLAARPRTAADLAKETGLSKPTISHHVFQLRAAGLLVERSRGKAVEALSGRLVARLFGAGDGRATAAR